MSHRGAVAALCVLACWSATGCMLVESMTDATKQTWRQMRPKPDDYDPSTESDEEWKFVGKETRQHYRRERDPDRWYKKYIMSEKANSIEHNLGID
ncbi:MAG: hypothetical protein IT428_18610 [Planctomycetaceae bacterium]|nr:hypothetical protein [Planctomycetaceae bacterium]